MKLKSVDNAMKQQWAALQARDDFATLGDTAKLAVLERIQVVVQTKATLEAQFGETHIGAGRLALLWLEKVTLAKAATSTPA